MQISGVICLDRGAISALAIGAISPRHAPVHDWCNEGHGICYPVCGMMHIKDPLLLIGKRSPCGGSRFLLSLPKWSFTICFMPYNRK